MCRDVVAVLKRLKEQRDMSLNEVGRARGKQPWVAATSLLLSGGPLLHTAAQRMQRSCPVGLNLVGLHRAGCRQASQPCSGLPTALVHACPHRRL